MRVSDQRIQDLIDTRSCDDELFMAAKELQELRRVLPEIREHLEDQLYAGACHGCDTNFKISQMIEALLDSVMERK